MNDHHDFYTASMAKVYAAQGHIEKAAEVYQYLLARSPERQDLAEALAALKRAGGENHPAGQLQTGTEGNYPHDLSGLCEKWVRMLIRYNHIRMLRKGAKGFEKNSDRR